jgi:hypothetical protein
MIDAAIIINIVVFALIFVFLLHRGYISVYSGLFVYLIFHFMVFVQRPLIVHYFDLKGAYYYMGYMPTDDVFLKTILVSNLGLLSFIFGYLWAVRFQPLKPNFAIPAISPIQRRAFVYSFLLLSPLILYSFFLAYTLRQAYGTEVFFSGLGQLQLRVDPATGSNLFVDTSAYIIGARHMILPFAALLVVLKRGKLWSYLPLICCIFVSLQLGERWLLVVGGLVICLLALYFRKRQQFTISQYFLMAIALGIFVILGQNRDAIMNFLLTGNFDLNFDLEQSSLGDHLDFANFEFLNYVLGKVPDISGTYSYFTQYLGLFTGPIPRVLWPSKPIGSPIVLVNLDEYGRFIGLSTSLVGDGWISLGYIGVTITMGTIGAIYGWLFRRFCRPSISIYYFCAYFWVLALLLQWARDGGYRTSDFYFFCTVGIVIANVLERTVLRSGRPKVRAQQADGNSSRLMPSVSHNDHS